MTEQLGDQPIDPTYIQMMNDLAADLDMVLNTGLKGKDRKTGFILMVFPFHTKDGRANYISNANRADVVRFLEEQLKRFKQQEKLGDKGKSNP